MMERERLYFIDRLRYLAVIVLIFFHSGLIFAAQSNFHIKNDELSVAAEEITYFFHSWRLALLFFISGVGTSLALKFRSKGTYIRERARRLLPPLIFGILVVVPPQIYFERLSQGFAYSSYLHFWLQSFSTGFYPYGNISWHHLWFVAYLFIYSVASVPLFLYIRSHKLEWLTESASRLGVMLWAVPLALCVALLKPFSSGVQNIVNDLAMFTFYWLVFVAGFVIQHKSYWPYFCGHLAGIALAAVLATCVVYYFKGAHPRLQQKDALYFWYQLARGASAWFWLLTILAFAHKYLNKPGKYLPLLNEAVFPMYILHQTAIVGIGYYVVQTEWPVSVKFSAIVACTIAICWLLFLLLRRSKLLRPVLGMK